MNLHPDTVPQVDTTDDHLSDAETVFAFELEEQDPFVPQEGIQEEDSSDDEIEDAYDEIVWEENSSDDEFAHSGDLYPSRVRWRARARYLHDVNHAIINGQPLPSRDDYDDMFYGY